VHTFAVRGANGDCTIPAGASAIVANVTAVAPSAGSFMTVWPADKPQPLASSLNYTAGQAPTPNAVTVALSGDGRIKVYNHSGNVHVIVDITGFYEDHTHDDRYYTQTQTDTALAGKSDVGHLHDDRYYTKAQVDAVAGAHRRTISFPAQSLNIPPGSAIITPTDDGLAWTNSFSGGALLAIAKPTDFAGTGDVTLTVTFYRPSPASGNVRFFARPQDLQVGDSRFNDGGSVIGSTEGTAGNDIFRQTSISWPAAGEDRQLWNISLQRDSSVTNAFTGVVIVTSVSLSYDATR
jgi:hypothetical protein